MPPTEPAQTDLDLLQAAAKAAGLKVWRGKGHQSDMLFRAPEKPSEIITGVHWTPLTDSGQALELAVALRLDVWHHTAHSAAGQPNRGNIRSCGIDSEEDRPAAVRRAIVRAAASMVAAPATKDRDDA